MVLSFAPVSVFAEETEDDGSILSWEIIENDQSRIKDKLNTADFSQTEDPESSLKGDVRVSIVLDAPSALDMGYATKDIAFNPAAANYRESIKKDQDRLAKNISKKILGGKSLDVVWNLTLAANIISANVPAEKIPEIRAMDGVKKVVIENQYEPQEVVYSDDPNMSVATGMTNAQYAWAQGYTGAGSRIAIVDTGLDYQHQSFNSLAFDMSIMKPFYFLIYNWIFYKMNIFESFYFLRILVNF